MTTFTSEDRISAKVDTFKWNPYQQQECIQFFWPLTEQIPLPLDYSTCEKPKLFTASDYPIGTTVFTGINIPTWTVSTSLKADTITITSKNRPPLYRRVLYKLLGINWEQK